ncbi:MAG: FHA domain-containing protein [Planctomycetaceae bacterium]
MKCLVPDCRTSILNRHDDHCRKCGALCQPVGLEINLGQALEPGQPGVLEWRIVGRPQVKSEPPCGDSLQVEVDVFSNTLRLSGGRTSQETLPSSGGHGRSQHLEFIPDAGAYLVVFHVHVNGHWIARGAIVINVSHRTSGVPSHVTIIGQQGEAEAILVGNPKIDLTFNPTSVPSPMRATTFSPVPLELETPVSVGRSRGLKLTTPDGREITLLAGTTFRIGRRPQRGEAPPDVLLKYGANPPNEPNLSRRHAEILFRPEGALWVHRSPNECQVLGGRSKVPQNGSIPLDIRRVLRPGDELTVVCEHFAEPIESPRAAAYRRQCLRIGEDYLPPTSATSAVRVTVAHQDQQVGESVLFEQVASLGSFSSCPIQLEYPSVAKVHARIVFLAGVYWLETTQGESPVFANDEPIPIHHRVRLTTNTCFRLGEEKFYVLELPPLAIET